jgi:excisionase family DNA binding protein
MSQLRHGSPVLLTSPQVAQRLTVSLRTVHRLVSAGKLIPAQQLPGPNGAYLFEETTVEQFARSTKREAGVA